MTVLQALKIIVVLLRKNYAVPRLPFLLRFAAQKSFPTAIFLRKTL